MAATIACRSASAVAKRLRASASSRAILRKKKSCAWMVSVIDDAATKGGMYLVRQFVEFWEELCIASLEGAVVLCRSTRSGDPLREVATQLEFLIKSREFVRRFGVPTVERS